MLFINTHPQKEVFFVVFFDFLSGNLRVAQCADSASSSLDLIYLAWSSPSLPTCTSLCVLKVSPWFFSFLYTSLMLSVSWFLLHKLLVSLQDTFVL